MIDTPIIMRFTCLSFFFFFVLLAIVACAPEITGEQTDTAAVVAVDTFMADRPTFTASYTPVAPTIDGLMADGCWLTDNWLPLDRSDGLRHHRNPHGTG